MFFLFQENVSKHLELPALPPLRGWDSFPFNEKLSNQTSAASFALPAWASLPRNEVLDSSALGVHLRQFLLQTVETSFRAKPHIEINQISGTSCDVC